MPDMPKQIKVNRKDLAKPKPKPDLDLRTPSGKKLPY